MVARLTDGREVYPHRPDLSSLVFWKCGVCGNYVGCHKTTNDKTRPLGCIPTPVIRDARQHIHALIDPAWKAGKVKRKDLYRHLTKQMGRPYHTADIRSLSEARKVYRIAREFLRNLDSPESMPESDRWDSE